MVNEGNFETGLEEDPSLEPQAELFHFQIYPCIIQEEDNSQDHQQGFKTPPLFCLPIW